MKSSVTERLKSVLSFFTTVPVNGNIELASSSLYLLPIVSFAIVLPASAVKYLLDMRFAPELSSIISISVLYVMTGIIHLDGLSDMFDGLAKQGTAEQRVMAMKDVNTGVAGTAAVVIVILIESMALSEINGSFISILSFLLTAELSAKLSMLSVLMFGKFREGMGMMFRKGFKNRHIIYFLIISIIFTVLIVHYWFMLIAGFAVGYALSLISKRYFNGASGDIIGAANELSRLTTMLLMCLAY